MKKSGKESRKEVKGCSDSDMKVLEKLQEPGTSSGRVRQERSPLKTTTLLNHFVGRDKQGAHTSYSTHQHSTDTDSTKECPTVVSVSGRYELYRNFIKRADDSVALGGVTPLNSTSYFIPCHPSYFFFLLGFYKFFCRF